MHVIETTKIGKENIFARKEKRYKKWKHNSLRKKKVILS